MREERSERSREGEMLAGKYRLERRLGTGGMGDVYRATNTVIGRKVAIKMLRAEHAKNETLIKRILSEARAATIVRHPHVVDVLDIGQDALGLPFIVAELLEGEDLAHRLARAGGRLDAREAVTLLLPVVEAMGVAHEKGVIHRDIKPANVFLARSGKKVVPKLLDFGISYVGGDVRLTSTGVAMGTPAYMSPEQIMASRTVDARADVWAFGVLLYELLSGRLPFLAEVPSAIFVMISTVEPTPLEDLVFDVPKDVARIVRKCLRKNRADRYADARELASDLRAFLAGRPSTATADSVRKLAVAGRAPVDRRDAPTMEVDAEPAKPAAAAPSPEAPDLGAPLPRPAASRPRAPALPVAHVGGFVELAGDVESDSGLRIATLRPPRVAPAAAPLPEAAATHDDAVDPRALTRALLMGAIVLATGAVLTFVNPARAGWPILAWAGATFGGMPSIMRVVAAVGVAIAGVLTGVQGLRMGKVSIGHVAAAAGMVVGAVLLVVDAASEGGSASAASLLAVCAAIIPGGLAIFGLRRAWESWASETPGAKSAGVVFAVLAAAGFFAAMQILRGMGAPTP